MPTFHVEYAKADEYRQHAKDALELALEKRLEPDEAADEIIDLLLKAAISYCIRAMPHGKPR